VIIAKMMIVAVKKPWKLGASNSAQWSMLRPQFFEIFAHFKNWRNKKIKLLFIFFVRKPQFLRYFLPF
jgi:hypothetical protein